MAVKRTAGENSALKVIIAAKDGVVCSIFLNAILFYVLFK